MAQQEQNKESGARAEDAAVFADLKIPDPQADSNAGADSWFDAKMAERIYGRGGFVGGPGVSAHTIYHTLRGPGMREDPAGFWPGHPYDDDDFGRCVELLDAAPAWRSRLGEMKEVSPVWAKLAEYWETIERAFRSGETEKVRSLIKLAMDES